MTNVRRIDRETHPEYAHEVAQARKEDAMATYHVVRTWVLVVAFLILLACAPAIVIATWRWGL